MGESGWERRFFGSTRGRVLALLRRASRTVDELARALGLTDNAVRAHLATLERDGLVRQEGLRRGAGKPAYAYDLTPAAERLFPSAYGPLLDQLLAVLAERLPPDQVEAILRQTGRRLAATAPAAPPAADLRARVERALALLDSLGGLAELEERDGKYVIQGYRCPLAAVVPDHPAACLLAEALLADAVGAPVRECCERADRPCCRFEIPVGATPLAEES